MKRQDIIETRASRVLATIAAVVRAVEEYNEDYEPDGIRVDLRLESLLGDNVMQVRVNPGSEHRLEYYEEELWHGRVEIIPDENAWGVTLTELFRRAPRIAWKLERGMFVRAASTTTSTGLEFMYIYLRDGRVVELEGEEYRVSIPSVGDLAAAIVHTHPAGSCGLSKADVRSGIDHLVEGGLFEAAVTERCMIYMARIGLVSEEDYLKVWGSSREIIGPLNLKTIEVGVLY